MACRMDSFKWNVIPLLLLLWIRSLHGQTWDQTCPEPPSCLCKIYNNKKVAECQNWRFSTIPSKLSPEFQVLDLTNNSIRSLFKDTFKKVNLVNLNRLILANNKISEVDRDAFNDLRLLMDLDLSNNQIKKLHPETFSGMEKMRKLVLSGNLLTRLEAYQFPVLPNLQHLLINKCKLSYINNLAFNNLPKLTSIGLKSNSLTTLQRELFTARTELKIVELSSNKWNCDCRLRSIVHWIQKENIGESQLSCYSPERVAGKRWLDLNKNDDLACPPVMFVPRTAVTISPGSNATLSCGASGEPLPRIQWIRDGLVIRKTTSKILPTDPQIKFHLVEDFVDGVLWLNLTIEYASDKFLSYDSRVNYKCKVDNPAELKEQNVSLDLQAEPLPTVEPPDNTDIYLIIAIVTVLLLVLILIVLIIVFCLRRKNCGPCSKGAPTERSLSERNNILIVNPVEKPPRKGEQYEKLPQAEIELTDLSNGTHKNFEEMNYPEERQGRVRAPLTALEEEEFDQSSQKLLDLSMNTTTTVDFPPQFPDLLDNVHFPRAISPTELSYHSLSNPLFSPSPEWRCSYVYPSEYAPGKYPTLYTIPQNLPHQPQRPGYVTLPRRPRTSSVTSSNAPSQSSPLVKFDPVYDTLGPRTTADGTSRTDLTRPMSRSMIDPSAYSPNGVAAVARASPSGSAMLPVHYIAVQEDVEVDDSKRVQSKTLPRSAPNLLEEKQQPIANGTKTKPNGRVTTVDRTQSPRRMSGSIVTPSTKAVSFPSTSLESAATDRTVSKKKVPPKPPPKPVNKRSSIASTNSDAASRLSSIASGGERAYQDEGPDGTEV